MSHPCVVGKLLLTSLLFRCPSESVLFEGGGATTSVITDFPEISILSCLLATHFESRWGWYVLISAILFLLKGFWHEITRLNLVFQCFQITSMQDCVQTEKLDATRATDVYFDSYVSSCLQL